MLTFQYSWSGSRYFSSLVKSSSKRSTLVSNIMTMVETYSLDGINLDWGKFTLKHIHTTVDLPKVYRIP